MVYYESKKQKKKNLVFVGYAYNTTCGELRIFAGNCNNTKESEY